MKNIGHRLVKLVLFTLAMLLITERKAQGVMTSSLKAIEVDKDFQQPILIVVVALLLWFATD